MKKPLKYIVLTALLGLVGYQSVYIKKLSEVNNAAGEKFDAAIFAKKLWDEKMPAKIDSAVDLAVLMNAVTKDKEGAFQHYSNALGIGNYRYALIKTSAKVTAVNEDEIQLQIPVADSVMSAVLATEYIYGNAIRDASGLIDIKDFPNSSDLNGLSEAMNKIVRTTVLPSFKTVIKKGDTIHIIAAVELNKEHIKWTGLELLPIRLQIIQ